MFAGILKRTSVRSKTKTCWNGKRYNRSRISSVDRPLDSGAGGCRFDSRDWTNSHTTLYLLYQLVKVFNPDGATPSVRINNRGTLIASLGVQEKTNCTSMLWSIDSYQNRASADQYHLTVPRAQVSTYRGRVFFEVIRWQFTSFKWSQFIFSKDLYQIYLESCLLWQLKLTEFCVKLWCF